MKSAYGLEFEVTNRIHDTWNEWDKSVAIAQMSNFGRIYIDNKYHKPIDNEYELEDIHKSYEIALTIMACSRPSVFRTERGKLFFAESKEKNI